MGLMDRLKSMWDNQGTATTGYAVAERNMTNMRPGDIITIDLVDYKVEGVTVYRMGMQTRYGYLLEDGAERRYLLAEEKENLRILLFETLDARLDNPEEINNEMVFEDVSYFLAAQGESTVDVTGKSALQSYEVVYWWLHLADDGRAMLFEWQQGEMPIRVGVPVKPYDIKILPGSD